MTELLIGSRNGGKLHEIGTLLDGVAYQFRSLNDFPEVGVAPEESDTYTENAISKARFYAAATGLNALADDSGLEVEALGGRPGVHSARYAGDDATDADRRAMLLSELKEANLGSRKARFVCAVALATPTGEVFGLFEGVCEGEITFEERGDGGFGYDSIFIPDGHTRTFGELDEAIKNRLSHRAKALEQTRQFLILSAPSASPR